MTVFICIVCFMLGWIAHKAADMYDRKRESRQNKMESATEGRFNETSKTDC